MASPAAPATHPRLRRGGASLLKPDPIMLDLFVPRIGAVFSADIAVPEHEREVRFYSRVLSTGDDPLWREADLMNNLGVPVIGLGERNAEYAHLPLQWMPHIQVADVAVSARRAVDLGGSELMHSLNEGGTSQWAVLLDPNGAAFGIIPVLAPEVIRESFAGAPPHAATSVGRIGWLDLTVGDAFATRDFYRQVVGWSAQEVAMRDGGQDYADFNMLGEDGSPLAGICHARGANADLPPVWLIYLPVGDIGESLRRVPEEGGRILKAMRGAEGEYVYAAIQDPVGASFALIPP
jgi:uncharacterized protein